MPPRLPATILRVFKRANRKVGPGNLANLNQPAGERPKLPAVMRMGQYNRKLLYVYQVTLYLRRWYPCPLVASKTILRESKRASRRLEVNILTNLYRCAGEGPILQAAKLEVHVSNRQAESSRPRKVAGQF